jgi:heat shock protein HslJ
MMNEEGHIFYDVKRNQVMDVAGVGYSGSDNLGNSILVQVFYQKCKDTMSDEEKPFRVSVELNVADGVDQGEQGLNGCGEYTEDKRLNGTWIVATFKGKEVVAVSGNKIPVVGFDTEKNSISANMGCNGMGGNYEIMDNKMFISPNFMSTQMYCEGLMALEKDFSSSFAGKTVTIQFKEKILVLFDMEGKELLTLKRK